MTAVTLVDIIKSFSIAYFLKLFKLLFFSSKMLFYV